jgi:hypothetical protein
MPGLHQSYDYDGPKIVSDDFGRKIEFFLERPERTTFAFARIMRISNFFWMLST